MNKYKLLELASKAGYGTIGKLAEASEIPRNTMSAKLNGHRSFDTDEVKRICMVIGLTDGATKSEIFLN